MEVHRSGPDEVITPEDVAESLRLRGGIPAPVPAFDWPEVPEHERGRPGGERIFAHQLR